MNKNNLLMTIVIVSWNIGLIILSIFCCWYFKTLWGLIPLVFERTLEIKGNEEKHTTEWH